MALINCSECTREISDRAERCPHCGNPMRHAPQMINVAVPPVENRNNGLGVAGFVVSLIGAIFFWAPFFGLILLLIGFLLSVIGLIVGIAARRNKGLSIAGLIVSLLFLILIALITYEIFAPSSLREYNQDNEEIVSPDFQDYLPSEDKPEMPKKSSWQSPSENELRLSDSDLPSDIVTTIESHFNNECFILDKKYITGDFDGDGLRDYALILVSNTAKTLVIVNGSDNEYFSFDFGLEDITALSLLPVNEFRNQMDNSEVGISKESILGDGINLYYTEGISDVLYWQGEAYWWVDFE